MDVFYIFHSVLHPFVLVQYFNRFQLREEISLIFFLLGKYLLSLINRISHSMFFFPLKYFFDIISKIDLVVNSGKLGSAVKPKSLITSNMGAVKKHHKKPFDAMNNIVANLLLSLTR